MFIQSLELNDFRNYQSLHLEPSAELTILVGRNAVGKTNAIEGLQLLTSTRSFRRPKWEDVVRWGAERAILKMQASGEDTLVETRLEVSSAGKRSYSVNGSTKRRFSDVEGIVPSVVFTPDDLDMVKGSSEARRNTIDDLGEQLSATYGSLRRDYGRVVRSRNKLLKEGRSFSETAPWTDQLVKLGARLTVHRIRLLKKVIPHVEERYRELSEGEKLSIHYVSKSGLGEDVIRENSLESVGRAMVDELIRRESEEVARQTTLVGPHRDDVAFEVQGRGARTFASQGQQRTVAIAWKMAEVAVIEEIGRKVPILLLDDVMSELDEVRRRALTDVMQRGVQTFVTTTNLDYFEPEMIERSKVVRMGER